MDELERALRTHFGFERFRPGQREVLENVLAQRPTLAVLPTGLGKSLCYQLAAQLLDGLTIVVSPLVALMQDQVEALARRGFQNVTSLSSALSPQEIGQRYHELEQGRYKLVYVAPERCDAPRFQQLVRQMKIALVVIDEAHCISQWGHDFRPHYRTLFTRLPELRRATFLAVTATATPEVQNDIAAALALPDMARISADFNRPNLHFEAVRIDAREEKDARLVELLARNDGPAIVYASTRKEANLAYQLLQAHGCDVGLYHAGLEAAQRTAVQRRFQRDECRIIVATVAFGLGIDKPNVRRVIHYNVPGSLENYYQEAGRAGRAGQAAVCTLFYTQSDVRIQRFLLEQAYPDPRVIFRVYDLLRDSHPLPSAAHDLAVASQLPELTVNAALQLLYEQHWLQLTAEGKYVLAQAEAGELSLETTALSQRRWRANDRLQKMISYALEAHCRRVSILSYFGQTFTPPCGACDVCCAAAAPVAVPQTAAPATETSDRTARAILQAAADLHGRYGRLLVADLLAGSKRKRILELNLEQSPHHGALRWQRQEQVLAWVDELIAQQKLQVTAEEYPRLLITEAGRRALNETAWLALSGLAQAVSEPVQAIEQGTVTNSSEENSNETAQSSVALMDCLKRWRREKARALSVPAYVVLHDAMLTAIAETLPRTPEDLGAIKGIGAHKLAQFGAEIIALIQSAHPASEAPRDWRLQVEIWRQGGAEPEREKLLAQLAELRQLEREELVVLINACKDLGVTQAAEALQQLLSETSDGYLLAAVCEALGQLGVRTAAPALLGRLTDERPSVRRAAVRALGRLRVREAADKLAVLAEQDRMANVRLAATAALWLLKAESK